MHVIGGIILFILLAGGAGTLLARESARAWDTRWPGTRPTSRQARDWAVSGARSAASGFRARAVRARRSGYRGVRVLGIVLDEPVEASPGRPAAPPQPAAARPPSPAAPGTAPVPHRIVDGTVTAPPRGPLPAPAAVPAPPTGRTIPVTTPAIPATALGEDIAGGFARIRAVAVAGNINDKQAAYAAVAEACDAAAALLDALAASMEEESMYGPEITEPARGLATCQRACSRAAAETEEQLSSLAKTPLGEVPASRHRAPDRRELAESGGR